MGGAAPEGGGVPVRGRHAARDGGVARVSGALLLLGAAAAAAAAAACGSGAGLARVLPGPGGRLNPIYDVAVAYPDTEIILGGLTHRGLEIELEIEFADATVRDDDPLFLAEARVHEVRAGGLPQPFAVEGPLDVEGTIHGDQVATGFFGPIRVGTAGLVPDLAGRLDPGRRRVTGEAALYGATDRGTFLAVKRRRYLVAGTDFQTFGKASVVSVRFDTRFGVSHDVAIISGDPVARVSDGRPLIVNRYTFDNLQGLDPSSFVTVFQHSAGNGANPHDAVILSPAAAGVPEAADPPGAAGAAGGTGAPGAAAEPAGGHPGFAFVTRYEPPYDDVAVLDLRSGAVVDRIDLRPFARNRDATPRADRILEHDGLLWVTLQDADRSFTEFRNGRIALIDPAARRVVDVIDLDGQNPFEALLHDEETGLVYAGLAGIFPGLQQQALTGGIAVIDPETRAARLLVDDDLLGGNVTAVAVHPSGRGFCVVSDASFRNALRTFDPASGEPGAVLYETANFIAAIAADGDGYLVAAEVGFFEPRLLVFDAATGLPVASLPARLPPLSIAVLTRSL
jgi:hypothetical protein